MGILKFLWWLGSSDSSAVHHRDANPALKELLRAVVSVEGVRPTYLLITSPTDMWVRTQIQPRFWLLYLEKLLLCIFWVTLQLNRRTPSPFVRLGESRLLSGARDSPRSLLQGQQIRGSGKGYDILQQ